METVLEKLAMYPQHVSDCKTFAEFINAIPITDRLRKYLHGQDRDYNQRWFLTFKHHGFSSKPLLFPNVTNINELFDDAKLLDTNIGNQMYKDESVRAKGVGYIFASGNSAGENANIPFGHLGGRYYIKVDKENNFFCFGQGGEFKHLATFVAANDKLRTALGVYDKFDFSMEHSSFEFIKQQGCTKILIIARREYGSEWIAKVDTADFSEMIGVDSMNKWDEYKSHCMKIRAMVDGKDVDIFAAKELGVLEVAS